MLVHFNLYLIEAALLGAFMIAACLAVMLVEHPASGVRRRIGSALVRRGIIGMAMGVTAVVLITSPWGRLSGAHMNPAVTLAFTLLGKVRPIDAVGYIAGQCLGGIVGMLACATVFRRALAHPSVAYIVTEPAMRPTGWRIAFAAELAISFIMLATVLVVSNLPVTMAYTPLVAGTLLVLFIMFEAPLSGMSLNPARTLASAVAARRFCAWPVYVAAPTLGMAGAAMLYMGISGSQAVHCAKLDHRGELPCPFRCTIESLRHPRGDSGIEAAANVGGR